MQVYVKEYGFVDSSEIEKIVEIKKEQNIIIQNANDGIKSNKESWLLNTKVNCWKYSSFANHKRNEIVMYNRWKMQANIILSELNELSSDN